MAELNSRVGRTMPSPLFGVLVAEPAMPQRSRRRPAWPTMSRPVWMLAALAAALWPHWIYLARRMVDGSDEPWGALALATVAALLWRDRGALVQPTRAAVVASAALAVMAAAAHLIAPDLAAAVVAMLALGMFLVHALQRPATPIAVLLLLALPVIASLQFYLGFPLRVLVAHVSSWLLWLSGLDVSAAGASIVLGDRTVLIDAPCAGIGMLWLGSYLAALASHLQRADARLTALAGVLAGALVLLANIARNTVLFFPESGLVHWPAWTHEAVGLAAFIAAMIPLLAFVTHRSRRTS
ncbi:MAG TPA: archaeosortase/exosortase family protein [Burkholderiaceae bacterium]|nr:archaeosortase/exosortase family protein [Burkholderiaceae bacterium]